MAFNWQCPYCGNHSTITDQNASSWLQPFDHNNYTGDKLGIRINVIVCPNIDCGKVEVNAVFGPGSWRSGLFTISSDTSEVWKLLPTSQAIQFPEYLPKAVLDDYEEACKIKDLSPKASATLSRRCLQGIIRDFWGVSKSRLVDEIEAIKDKVDIDTWAAIDAVRKIGNIGAHMERDINIIIDVDPSEAQLLIGLIEMLIKDWYIARHKRQVHLQQIVESAKSKK